MRGCLDLHIVAVRGTRGQTTAECFCLSSRVRLGWGRIVAGLVCDSTYVGVRVVLAVVVGELVGPLFFLVVFTRYVYFPSCELAVGLWTRALIAIAQRISDSQLSSIYIDPCGDTSNATDLVQCSLGGARGGKILCGYRGLKVMPSACQQQVCRERKASDGAPATTPEQDSLAS